MSSQDWDLVHKAATRVVNARRRRLILSNEEADDCISELVLEFVTRAADYRDGDYTSKRKWLERHMWLRLNDVLDKLRKGGLTGEVQGGGAKLIYNIEGRAPKSRGRGDTVVGGRENHRPMLSDLLEYQSGDDAHNAASVDALLAQLGPNDAELLVEYYGLQGGEPSDVRTMAAARGVSKTALNDRILGIQKKLRTKASKPRTINTQHGGINSGARTDSAGNVGSGSSSEERRSVA